MEIKDLKVTSFDPFLNASKWNGALDYSQNFEGMLGSILGLKFKGIYSPELDYSIGDYVWNDGNCYVISNKSDLVVTKEQVENAVVSYYKNGGFYLINDNKISYFNNGVINPINITNIDYFMYRDSKPYFFGYKNLAEGTRIYKIPLNGKVEAVNANFQTPVKLFSMDDFYGYAMTEANVLNKFPLDNPSASTFHTTVSYSSNYDVVCMDASKSYIHILNSNCDFLTINKDGGVIKNTNVRNYIKNKNLAKFAVTDGNSVVITDGEDKAHVFIIESNKSLRFSYTLNVGIGKINEVRYSNKYLTFTSDSLVAYVLASEYEFEMASLRKLVATASTLEIKNAILSLDFGRGQLVSNGETMISPSNFSMNPSFTNNGTYSDGTNTAQFVGNRGIQLHGSYIRYDFASLHGKTLICEFDSATPNIGFVSIPVSGKSVVVPACTKQVDGVFKTGYIIEHNVIKATVTKHSEIIERFEIVPNGAFSEVLSFSSENSVLISKVILVNTVSTSDIDFLLSCSFNIGDCYKNQFLPTPTNNANGVRFLKPSDRSIVNSESGISVNFSSDLTSSAPDIGLSLEGARMLYDTLVDLYRTIEADYAKKDHTHKFSEILDVPIASISGIKGIVSLSSSINLDDDTVAATSKAAMEAYNKGVEAQAIAETKLNNKPGTTDSFYLKHSAQVSGNVAVEFKTAKTGMFNGTNLENSMPWGENSWKYYFTNSHGNEEGYTGIISIDFNGGEMGFTTVAGGVLQPWSRVWNSKNFDPSSKSDNHSHPYLSSDGGTLNGNLRIAHGRLDIAKAGYDSWICFDAQSNDPGYIRHHENNNSSIMFHSVSDDRGRQDYFSWGSTPGGNYSQCAYMYTDGYFHTDGGIHASGDIAAFSDIRLKENIVGIENAIELTKQLNGVIFDRKDNGLRQTGLIAQDVLKVMPEAVTMDEKGYYSVNYGSLVGLLVESIKELKAEIEELKNNK